MKLKTDIQSESVSDIWKRIHDSYQELNRRQGILEDQEKAKEDRAKELRKKYFDIISKEAIQKAIQEFPFIKSMEGLNLKASLSCNEPNYFLNCHAPLHFLNLEEIKERHAFAKLFAIINISKKKKVDFESDLSFEIDSQSLSCINELNEIFKEFEELVIQSKEIEKKIKEIRNG